MTIEEKFNINVMRAEIYKLYQLDWMSFRGYDPIELCEMISDRVAERIRDEIGDPYSNYDVGQGGSIGGRWYDKGTDDTIEEEMNRWKKDEGFGGSLWASMDEFLNSEYKSASYVYNLTSRSRNKRSASGLVSERHQWKWK